MEFTFKPPKSLRFEGNVSDNWTTWKQQFNIFMRASGKEAEPKEAIKVAYFLNLVGEEGIKVFNGLKLDENTIGLNEVMAQFEAYCKPRKNVVYERFCFLSIKQKEGQPFDAYLTELKNAASKCEYGDQEEGIIRDQIVFGVVEPALKERLLREKDLNLEKVADYCRATEFSKRQAKELLGESAQIDVIKSTFNRSKNNVDDVKSTDYRSKNNVKINCKFCGYQHFKAKCPAYNRTCSSCKQKNHFAKMCRNKIKGKQKHVNNCEISKLDSGTSEESDDDYNNHNEPGILYVAELSIKNKHPANAWYEKLEIEKKRLDIKLDSGAEVSIMPAKILRALKIESGLKPTNTILLAYGNNSFKLKPQGYIELNCKSSKGKKAKVKFLVVDVTSDPILGLKDCLALKLIERVNEVSVWNKDEILKKYAKVFEGTGQIPGKHHITINPEIQPVINLPRRVPIGLEKKLRDCLNKLEDEEIVSKVDKPTSWVSSLVIIEKQNGSLRLCLDPKALNSAIKREHYLIPTPEDIVAKLEGKAVFSVFDMRDGFWQIQLDEESANLCTFNTPFGRYRFNRLPFGISSAPEVFQKKNTEIFGDLPGVSIYFDDIIISGENKRDHDNNLEKFLKRATQFNVKFNGNKLQLGAEEIKYCGQVISKHGVKLDEKYIKAIQKLDDPKNKNELLSFLGMIKYLSKFIPDHSKITAPLRDLVKDKFMFQWHPIHSRAVEKLKAIISKTPVLRIFNSRLPLTIQTDASKDGLGACLMQDGQPVAFVSRSLTECEKRYAQIEKELLAIQFSCEKFHYYIYGRKVLVNTDHKPLEVIFKRDLNRVSARLQRMRLRLLKYELEVKYLRGKFMYIADYLSRSFLKDPVEDDIELREMVHSVSRDLPMSEKKKKEFQTATIGDDELREVMRVCAEGWPKSNKAVPKKLIHYWKNRHDIVVSEGLVFLGEKIVVPVSLRKQMIHLLHENHFGIEKTKSRARQLLYWQGMAHDITAFITSCRTCERYANKNQKEPLKPQKIPSRPWERVSTDILEYGGKSYLVVVDSYSRWLELEKLKGKTALDVIKKLKKIFSRQGIPDLLMSDNMPFSSASFLAFAEDWGFGTITSSPRYPQSNGLAEKGVNIAKKMLKKGKDIESSLLEYRNSPIVSMGISPSQMLNSRRLKDKIPVKASLLWPKPVDRELVLTKLEKNQNNQKNYFDRGTKQLKPLEKGNSVLVEHEGVWIPGRVLEKHESPRSYVVERSDGQVVRRNRVQLKKSLNAFVSHRDEVGAFQPEKRLTVEDDIRKQSTEASPTLEEKLTKDPVEESPLPLARPRRNVRLPSRLNDYWVELK